MRKRFLIAVAGFLAATLSANAESLKIYVNDADCHSSLAGMTVQVGSVQKVTTSSAPAIFSVPAGNVTATVLAGNGYLGRTVTFTKSEWVGTRDPRIAVFKALTGTVTDSAGKPVPRANVMVYWAEGKGEEPHPQTATGTTMTSPDGHFSINPPWPLSSYRVSVNGSTVEGSPQCGVPLRVAITVK